MLIEQEIFENRVAMPNEVEADCNSGGIHSSESRRDAGLDYEFEGAYHEAGHAIVRAYLKKPFVYVTVEMVPGVHTGYTHVVPHTTKSYQDFIGVAMFAAAGRLATDIYMESSPGMTRWNESDRDDQKSIDAQAWQMYATLGLHPEQWKAGIVARTAAVLRTPYVWAAVEELAWQLLETGGEYAIPAKQVRRILWQAKEEG